MISYRTDTDGTLVSPGKRKPYRQDHLFEDLPREGAFGVFISRKTKYGLAIALKQYARILPKARPSQRDQIGDSEACLYFETNNPAHIPDWFKKSQKMVDAGREKAARIIKDFEVHRIEPT